jgi:hypothetical protein
LEGHEAITRDVSNLQPCSYYRLIPLIVGSTRYGQTANYHSLVYIAELRFFGYEKQPTIHRAGQVDLNSEVITCDKTLFKRPIRIQLTSPTRTNLTTMGPWSAELEIFDEGKK